MNVLKDKLYREYLKIKEARVELSDLLSQWEHLSLAFGSNESSVKRLEDQINNIYKEFPYLSSKADTLNIQFPLILRFIKYMDKRIGILEDL